MDAPISSKDNTFSYFFLFLFIYLFIYLLFIYLLYLLFVIEYTLVHAIDVVCFDCLFDFALFIVCGVVLILPNTLI